MTRVVSLLLPRQPLFEPPQQTDPIRAYERPRAWTRSTVGKGLPWVPCPVKTQLSSKVRPRKTPPQICLFLCHPRHWHCDPVTLHMSSRPKEEQHQVDTAERWLSYVANNTSLDYCRIQQPQGGAGSVAYLCRTYGGCPCAIFPGLGCPPKRHCEKKWVLLCYGWVKIFISGIKWMSKCTMISIGILIANELTLLSVIFCPLPPSCMNFFGRIDACGIKRFIEIAKRSLVGEDGSRCFPVK